MDVYWVNCFLAAGLAYVAGFWMAERKFKHMLMRMMQGTMGAAIVGTPKDTKDN